MRWRSFFRFHLLTLLLVVATLCWLLAANTRRQRAEVLGHISIHDGPLAPGLWIMGHDYGWPFKYQTKSDDSGDAEVAKLLGNADSTRFFDHFYARGLAGNVFVAALLLLAVAALSEAVLWGIRRIGKLNSPGKPTD